ncbi:MAG: hypothetical protein HYT76_03755 [Deltaproteobacteria bacterium]|nr:hypothetical protein [Deltaproteobacteria bacterium]
MNPSHYIIACFLCDPVSNGRLSSPGEDSRYWNSTEKCIQSALQLKRMIGEEMGFQFKFTWLIRTDRHVEMTHGDSAWPLKKFEKLWKQVKDSGDEIGWLFYPTNLTNGEWSQDDSGDLIELMSQSHEAFKNTLTSPQTSYFGWNGLTQASMKQLASLGVKIDLSAVPGLYTISHKRHKPEVGACDWEISPKIPYHPSTFDYRRPTAYPNEPALNILEVPCTIVKNQWARVKATLGDLWKVGNLGPRYNWKRRRQGIPLKLDNTPNFFQTAVRSQFESKNQKPVPLILVTNMLALLSKNLQKNMQWLAKEASSQGTLIRSGLAEESWEVWSNPSQIGLDPRRFQFIHKDHESDFEKK